MPLPNIIKICLRVSKLWSAQDFGFRGDNYITKKKVRVVSLAKDMPTGPLHFYQIISYYLKTVWELWPAHDFGFRGDNEESEIVTLAQDMPTGPLHFYQTLSKYV